MYHYLRMIQLLTWKTQQNPREKLLQIREFSKVAQHTTDIQKPGSSLTKAITNK